MLLSRARDGRWQGVDIATKARGAGGILQRSGSEGTCCPALVELSALILGGQVSQPSDVTLWLRPPVGLSCELPHRPEQISPPPDSQPQVKVDCTQVQPNEPEFYQGFLTGGWAACGWSHH